MKSILDDSNNISDVELNVTGSPPVKILGKDDIEPILELQMNLMKV